MTPDQKILAFVKLKRLSLSFNNPLCYPYYQLQKKNKGKGKEKNNTKRIFC